jgi:cytoskeletal protein RodZ
MSQINDALKRAKNAQSKNSPQSGVAPMRPIEPRKEERDYSWVLPVVIIVLVAIAVFFIAMFLALHKVRNIVAGPENSGTQAVENVSVPAPPVPPPAVIGPGAINTAPPAATQVQGIFYDPVHPWAIVSGKTVYVGDSVNGMRVTAIARNAITLTGNGQTNKLYVGQ